MGAPVPIDIPASEVFTINSEFISMTMYTLDIYSTRNAIKKREERWLLSQ
jgi:hypothetical protein